MFRNDKDFGDASERTQLGSGKFWRGKPEYGRLVCFPKYEWSKGVRCVNRLVPRLILLRFGLIQYREASESVFGIAAIWILGYDFLVQVLGVLHVVLPFFKLRRHVEFLRTLIRTAGERCETDGENCYESHD